MEIQIMGDLYWDKEFFKIWIFTSADSKPTPRIIISFLEIYFYEINLDFMKI